ncbi:MAG: hypothetical protein MSC31_03110 [Solirubrobacteraceae bacterium MAG38_C4-C5]|nr:hypothetical protein [Candidatus Siliceabacter maunaloa]
MGVVERRQELLENIARLRRVGREMPGNRDITAVRAALERELGETVSRRLAARVLGVSHTALGRWIKAGDLPVVYSPSGRVEVPVPALLDLHDSVEADRAGGALRYPLTPTMTRQRDAARRMRVDDLKDLDRDDTHDRARARSLAYHRAVGRRLSRPMIDEVRHVLARWREQGRIDARYASRWEQALNRPVAEIRRALLDESPEADDLRQNSPFAGLLSEAERRRIVREVR